MLGLLMTQFYQDLHKATLLKLILTEHRQETRLFILLGLIGQPFQLPF
jgi:hypothetical protein